MHTRVATLTQLLDLNQCLALCELLINDVDVVVGSLASKINKKRIYSLLKESKSRVLQSKVY